MQIRSAFFSCFIAVLTLALHGVAHGTTPASAANDTPTALALDITGPSKPEIEPFSELLKSDKITLGPNTVLEFIHYASCQSVTVQGGRLSFSNQRYFLKGGQILDQKRTECPKSVALSGASQIGGIVLRNNSGRTTLRVSTKPSFVLIGKQGATYTAIRVTQNDKLVLEGALNDRVFHWPDSVAALKKGTSYTVVLTPEAGGTPRQFSLKASSSRKKSAMTLIRLD